jgi:hypothetical protein
MVRFGHEMFHMIAVRGLARRKILHREIFNPQAISFFPLELRKPPRSQNYILQK